MADNAFVKKNFTIAFNCYFLLRNVDKCVECLVQAKNYPEAALFAKTYCPSHISGIVTQWKNSLAKAYPIICRK